MVHNTKKWNPPTAQLAVWKSYADKNGGHLKRAHDQIPEPKPSYAVFIGIMNTAFGLSPLQRARRNKSDNDSVKNHQPLNTVQPFRTAPPVPINKSPVSRDSEKILEIIWSAIKASNMNGDEFKGFVKGLLTMNELK